MFDLAVVGHFAIDLITSPSLDSPRTSLGGPPTYVSVSARRIDAKVSVISKVGDDFPDEYVRWLESCGIDLSGLIMARGCKTTRFVLEYDRFGGRRLRVSSRAPPILGDDIPASLDAKAIHVAPIVNEVSAEAINRVRDLVEILTLDPQGFIRRISQGGIVQLVGMKNLSILRNFDVMKASQREIRIIAGGLDIRRAIKRIQGYGVRLVIATLGGEGAFLTIDKRLYRIPPCTPERVVDLTGAGDAFMGGFLAEYVRDKDPIWCASVGSASASLMIEGLGPYHEWDKADVYARASQAYENVVNEGSL
ncbi:hypothetical protein DRJ16_06280 [Candidatus Woesearchaeota archaeon]|nr:MAG: hypothetical protein DRJ16_06280 [Candidatus Woesearchaeota archaeon]